MEQGGLPRARRAGDGDELPRRELHVDPVEDPPRGAAVAVGLGQPAGPQDRHRGHGSPRPAGRRRPGAPRPADVRGCSALAGGPEASFAPWPRPGRGRGFSALGGRPGALVPPGPPPPPPPSPRPRPPRPGGPKPRLCPPCTPEQAAALAAAALEDTLRAAAVAPAGRHVLVLE